MPRSGRVQVDQSAIAALASDRGVLAGAEQIAEAAAEEMRRRAPKDSGEGAESIHVAPDPDEPGFRIGWDKDHFYMLFPEFGTEHQPARPFMRPTADEFNRR